MTMATNEKIVQANVPHEHWRALRALAWARGMTQADLIRSLILCEVDDCAAEVKVAIEALDAKLAMDQEKSRRARVALGSLNGNGPSAREWGCLEVAVGLLVPGREGTAADGS